VPRWFQPSHLSSENPVAERLERRLGRTQVPVSTLAPIKRKPGFKVCFRWGNVYSLCRYDEDLVDPDLLESAIPAGTQPVPRAAPAPALAVGPKNEEDSAKAASTTSTEGVSVAVAATAAALGITLPAATDAAADGRGLSLAYNRPRVYASSQLLYSLYYH
jgi:hypothetical protein